MTKLIPIFINGEKWIQVSQLSASQALKLRVSLPIHSFKKIMFQGIELTDCLQFERYEHWFRSVEAQGYNEIFEF
jgi:hypothetical protein